MSDPGPIKSLCFGHHLLRNLGFILESTRDSRISFREVDEHVPAEAASLKCSTSVTELEQISILSPDWPQTHETAYFIVSSGNVQAFQ